MKSYESVIIVNSSLSEETLNKIVKRSEDFISKNGGKLGETIQWGKRRLAYPIKKFQYGYYFIFKFDASPEIISEFEREFRLDENILRFMTFLKTQKEVLAEQKLRELEAKVAEKAKATIENADDLEDEKTGAKQKPGSDKEPAEEAVDSTETPEEEVPAEDVKKETEEPVVETEPVKETEAASDVETLPAEDVKKETEEPVVET
ncbi:MAG: 30S ribosomal protein S6, partial [Planctomycetes bacterium]|nr:30S ribosomal protein S6 [Planctomycetota bacterium]